MLETLYFGFSNSFILTLLFGEFLLGFLIGSFIFVHLFVLHCFSSSNPLLNSCSSLMIPFFPLFILPAWLLFLVFDAGSIPFLLFLLSCFRRSPMCLNDWLNWFHLFCSYFLIDYCSNSRFLLSAGILFDSLCFPLFLWLLFNCFSFYCLDFESLLSFSNMLNFSLLFFFSIPAFFLVLILYWDQLIVFSFINYSFDSSSSFFIPPFQYFFLLFSSFFFKATIHCSEVYNGFSSCYSLYHIHYFSQLILSLFLIFSFVLLIFH